MRLSTGSVRSVIVMSAVAALAVACGSTADSVFDTSGTEPGEAGATPGMFEPDGGKAPADCKPQTCALAKANCGPIGDGCGGIVQCGTCNGAGHLRRRRQGRARAVAASRSARPRRVSRWASTAALPATAAAASRSSAAAARPPQICGGGGRASCGGGGISGPDGGVCVPLARAPPTRLRPRGRRLRRPPRSAAAACARRSAAVAASRASAAAFRVRAADLPAARAPTAAPWPTAAAVCSSAATASLRTSAAAAASRACGGSGRRLLCTGLCSQQVKCDGGGTTTITGTVYAPNGTLPIPNAVIYVPNGPVAAFTPGVTCEQCAAASGSPLVSTTSAFDGTFCLPNMPSGSEHPAGHPDWSLAPPDRHPGGGRVHERAPPATQTRLPKNKAEGDIPLTAISTGAVDALECVHPQARRRRRGVHEPQRHGPHPVLRGQRRADRRPDAGGVHALRQRRRSSPSTTSRSSRASAAEWTRRRPTSRTSSTSPTRAGACTPRTSATCGSTTSFRG